MKILAYHFAKQELGWPHLNCMDGSILALLNYTDGSVLAFLNCTDGSVLTHLNSVYCPSSGFPLNLVSLDFHSWGFFWYHGYYARKATKICVWNIMMFPHLVHHLSHLEQTADRGRWSSCSLFMCLWENIYTKYFLNAHISYAVWLYFCLLNCSDIFSI